MAQLYLYLRLGLPNGMFPVNTLWGLLSLATRCISLIILPYPVPRIVAGNPKIGRMPEDGYLLVDLGCE
jgi:hypothetical protein